eukprot:scaffold32300_cov118-Isochrysis_galbana.AAC.2
MRQATEAATEAAAWRREWTSAEASPYCPQARPRTGPKAARAPETAVVLPPLWAWTAGLCPVLPFACEKARQL